MNALRKQPERAIEPHFCDVIPIRRHVIEFVSNTPQQSRRFVYLIDSGRESQAVDEGLAEWE